MCDDTLSELKLIASQTKNEDEKWNEFLVEKKFKKVFKDIVEEDLLRSWTALKEIIQSKPISTGRASYTEVELLLTLVLKETVEKDENLATQLFFVNRLSLDYPLESSFYLPLVFDELLQKYIALPSSDEYVNRHGRNFCTLLATLYTMAKEDGCVLFETVRKIVFSYVRRWTTTDKSLGDLLELRMSVNVTALQCLLSKISEQISTPGSARSSVQTDLVEFQRIVMECAGNLDIPPAVRDIFAASTTQPEHDEAEAIEPESLDEQQHLQFEILDSKLLKPLDLQELQLQVVQDPNEQQQQHEQQLQQQEQQQIQQQQQQEQQQIQQQQQQEQQLLQQEQQQQQQEQQHQQQEQQEQQQQQQEQRQQLQQQQEQRQQLQEQQEQRQQQQEQHQQQQELQLQQEYQQQKLQEQFDNLRQQEQEQLHRQLLQQQEEDITTALQQQRQQEELQQQQQHKHQQELLKRLQHQQLQNAQHQLRQNKKQRQQHQQQQCKLQQQRREQLQLLQQQQIMQQQERQRQHQLRLQQQLQLQRQQQLRVEQQLYLEHQQQQQLLQQKQQQQQPQQKQHTKLNPLAKTFTPSKMNNISTPATTSAAEGAENFDLSHEYQITRGLGCLLTQLQI